MRIATWRIGTTIRGEGKSSKEGKSGERQGANSEIRNPHREKQNRRLSACFE
ncbi:hypothetical protein [Burkholderia glumae]|uniref:hypothetical protein n=1 Tax=Burkholderia glumae TaxID=337 RepID=UPI0012F974FE|nr:hypothetical protein [Burkholderia glumae]MCM2493396.1 hypothetical protein [Burkholderia glumae]MCM2544018.1 hypothetical protein [Burkholderia glumae]